MTDRILAEIKPSAPRRVIGVGALIGLGAMLLWIAFATPPAALHWQAFLILLGIGFLILGQRMWQATDTALILTEEELRDSGGTVLARLDDIARVDRGMFAMKPSNGFNIFLKEPGPRAWRPGLWWRWGRRVAVGGVTSGSQTRPVADILKLKIEERDGA